MKKAKYINQEHTRVQIVDSETGYNPCGPIHRLQKELEGLQIEPFKTPEELKADQIEASKSLRDSLLENITVEVKPDCWIKARKKDYANLKELMADLEPSEVYPNFTQKDPNGETKVFDVTREDIESAFQLGKLQTISLHQEHAQRVKAILAD